MADDAQVGRRLLAVLAAGRERAIATQREHGAITIRAVRRQLDVDVLEGRSERGRAGRIARRLRRLGLTVSERHVRRILADILSSVSDSSAHDEAIVNTKDLAA